MERRALRDKYKAAYIERLQATMNFSFVSSYNGI